MSWTDRRYDWSPYTPGGLTPAVKAILIVTVAAFGVQFLLAMMGEQDVVSLFALVPRLALLRLCLWQFVTYLFLHSTGNLLHILFNMLLLYWFGPGVERVVGSRQFVWFYLAAGAFAGLMHSVVDIAVFHGGVNPVIGASGAIMALLVLYAIHFPNQMILVFFVIPMKIKYLVMILIGADLLATLQPGMHQGVATVAHLGGAAFGYLYYRFSGRSMGGELLSGGTIRDWLRRMKQNREHKHRLHELEEDEQVDKLLEKISREGMNSLTDEERQFLIDAARRRRERK